MLLWWHHPELRELIHRCHACWKTAKGMRHNLSVKHHIKPQANFYKNRLQWHILTLESMTIHTAGQWLYIFPKKKKKFSAVEAHDLWCSTVSMEVKIWFFFHFRSGSCKEERKTWLRPAVWTWPKITYQWSLIVVIRGTADCSSSTFVCYSVKCSHTDTLHFLLCLYCMIQQT